VNTRQKPVLPNRAPSGAAFGVAERGLFDGMPDAIFLCDPNGLILDANAKASQLLQQSREQILAGRLDQVLGVTLEAPLAEVLQSTASFQWVCQFAAGREVPVEVRFGPLQSGEKMRVIASVREASTLRKLVTNLQDLQAFSDRLIHTASVMIVGLDRTGRIEILNEAAERILGYSREELLGLNWFEKVVPKEKYPAVFEMFQCGLLGQLAQRFENEVITKAGERRLISWQNSAVNEGEKIRSIVAMGTDITEWKIEEERRHSIERKMLDAQKLESLGVLAGGIAHDFNNLLTAVLGNASLMRLDLPRDSRHRQYLIEIERTALQAAGLCKQMLAYAGHHAVAISALDLNELILDMRQLLRVSAGRKAELNFDLGTDLPQIEADDAQLRQVVLNLIINAAEAMGEQAGSINVRTRLRQVADGELEGARFYTAESSGAFVELEVMDDGCGMSRETQQKIFDPFFTTKFTGRGLGLASVLGIVRSHHGILDLESREYEGTRFSVLFPAAKSCPFTAKSAEPERPLIDWLGSGKILVVEDEEGVRNFAMKLLELLGFECIPAVDGRDGLDKFLRHEGELRAVMLDLTMPRMNGAEVHNAIRVVNSSIPILLVSGYTRAASGAMQDPHTDFLQKPYQLSELRTTLQQLLGIVQ
jgi:PAS domain S-box-containing protein